MFFRAEWPEHGAAILLAVDVVQAAATLGWCCVDLKEVATAARICQRALLSAFKSLKNPLKS